MDLASAGPFEVKFIIAPPMEHARYRVPTADGSSSMPFERKTGCAG